MKISTSNIGMESARSYRASSVTYHRFEVKDYQSSMNAGTGMGNLLSGQEKEQTDNKASTTQEKKDSQDPFWANGNQIYSLQEKMMRVRGNYKVRTPEASKLETVRQQTIRWLFELLVAKRHHNMKDKLDEMGNAGAAGETENAANSNIAAGKENQNPSPMDLLFADFGSSSFQSASLKNINYSSVTYMQETEETSFSTTGKVVCSDGREIEFNVNVGMSRSFEAVTSQRLSMKDSLKLVDPLVINLDGNIADVSDQTFYFDIDNDGEKDLINKLGSGSGYLALDKNDDGVINDGGELFGTSSGDGFADLAKYDIDGNGWIDENDPIWSQLKIWTTDENGKDILYSLEKAGVGALCLSKVATEFSQKGEANQDKAVIRSSGVFLYENGNVGTLQHIDMRKYQKEA